MPSKSINVQKTIGLRLKKIRVGLDLTQAEMAEKIGGPHNVRVSRLETGYTKPPPNILKRYAELGNTTVDALLAEDSEDYQISESRSDKDSGQRYNTGSPNSNITGEAELEAMKDKYIEVLEENRELQKKVDSLKAELELFKSGKPKTQGRGNG